jgi:hypothetical protein
VVKVWLAKELAGLMIKGLHFSKKEHISSLRQSCQRHLETVLNSFFELASSTLLSMADRAETNRLQTLYLDAQRLVRTRRSPIESLVLERTMGSFAVLDSSLSINKAAKPRDSAGHNTPYNHLELLGNEDLEVMIALDNGTTKALETFKQPLYLLHRRFQTLAENDLSSAKPVPMSPDALLQCFSESICHDLIAVEIQVVLINLFSQLCFDHSYGRLLDQVDQDLENAGVLPVPEEAGSAQYKQPAPTQDQPVYTTSETANPDQESTDHDLEQRQAVVQKLKTRWPVAEAAAQTEASSGSEHGAEGLFEPAPEPSLAASTAGSSEPSLESPSRPSPKAPSQSPNTDPTPVPQTRIQTELLTRISRILDSTGQSFDNNNKATISRQRVFDEIDKQISLIHQMPNHDCETPSQWSEKLAQTLNGLEGQPGLHGNDSSIFKLVGNTFSRFSRANGLAPEAQQLINRCELPLLKLALGKPTLLEQENHPIRRLFNEMAEYAIGLESGNCAENLIYRKMLSLSEKMLSGAFEEGQIPQMLSEFISAIDTETRHTGLQAQRAADSRPIAGYRQCSAGAA